MRKLDPPNINHSDVLLSCISNIEDITLYDRVNSNLVIFETASNNYIENGLTGNLQNIQSHESVNNFISKSEMKFLYNKMVNKRNPARDYYDRLLHKSKKCPFCGYGVSYTLDHFLPKSEYPIYAVDPINLVPCCRDCNSTKLTKTVEKNDLFLHPYFDNVDDERWLFCEVGYFDTLAFYFKVEKPPSWSRSKYIKMKYHFDTFNLNSLFSGFASDEFSDSIYELKHLYDLSGAENLKEELDLKYDSCNNNLKNHWKTAMYDALRRETFFYEEWIEGFAF